jgi:hypothetical protein
MTLPRTAPRDGHVLRLQSRLESSSTIFVKRAVLNKATEVARMVSVQGRQSGRGWAKRLAAP